MEFKAIKRIPRELPWYPEWTKAAACARYTIEFIDDVFFDYGRNADKIRMAKGICESCPVIHKCREFNRYIPMGIYFGMTALERWRWNGFEGYPNSNKVGWSYMNRKMAIE